MSAILVKIFATALTLSQVMVHPEDVKTSFDPQSDRGSVVQILKDGCLQMRRAFDVEDINLDDLIATAMDDPQAVAGDVKVLQGLSFKDLHTAYREYCKGEAVESEPVDLSEVIAYYDKALADLPDHTKLKGLKLPGMSEVLDLKGRPYTELYEPDNRRVWVPLSAIPDHVRKAFVAAEDKRFYQHKGVDERGIIRAFIGNLTEPGRLQGGSTITQQVIKTILVGDDVTYERKMREMVLAARTESLLTKDEILEIYLNSIYLGRGSWGIEMAARSYFGKSAKDLTILEGALLAALTKGPNYYDPDRHPDRATDRIAYVITRMEEDGAIDAAQAREAIGHLPKLAALERPRRDSGFYFLDYLNRDARSLAGIDSLTAASYRVRTTVNPELQRATEAALQEGLARYELNAGRQRFEGAKTNLGDAVRALDSQAAPEGQKGEPAWQRALKGARLPLYDVHREPGVVVSNDRSGLRVGLSDGRILPLTTWSAADRKRLNTYDVVRVRVAESKGKASRAELRVPPGVQGAALVLENRTGRILAMAGGFSYPLSQLNRTTQAHRQPGSALKPVTYLAALAHGLQPNTLVFDGPITLPPVGGSANARPSDYWTPKNYDGGGGGIITLRSALEHSKNLVTARLLDGAFASGPEQSLKEVCDLAIEAQLYLECTPHYPFVLGAQPVRLIDLAAFYAAIANEGALPSPYAIESIEKEGRVVYAHKATPLVALGSADKAAFYQLKSMLQGVLARGTANALKQIAPYVAGKTGTSDDENDAWFVSFTNDVTVAVWAGYDNAGGKRRTLGRGRTGAKVALPIAKPILEASWAYQAPKAPLSPPSREAARQLIALPIDLTSGDRLTDGQKGFTEYFRLNRWGQLTETQFRLVPEQDAYAFRHQDPWSDGDTAGNWPYDNGQVGPYARSPDWFEAPQSPPPYAGDPWFEERPHRRPRRIDPDYFWGRGSIY